MSGSTSVLDSLPAVGPTPGMMAAGAAPAPNAAAKSNGNTSILDSLQPVAPTPGMVAANPQLAPPAAPPPTMSDAQRQAWLRAGINPLPPSSNSTVEAVRQWLAPDPNKAYTSIAPLSRDSSGLHLALPNIVRSALYGLTESPSEATTIDPNTGSLGLSPEAASVVPLAAGGLKFGEAPSAAAVKLGTLDQRAPLSKEFTANPLTPEMADRAIPAPEGPTSPTGVQAPAPTPSFTPPRPETAAAAKSLASSYYAAADAAGGTLTPAFTNKFIDEVGKIAPQTEAGLTVAGPTPITNLVQRIQALRDNPISLAGAQEIDEALSGLIDKEYGLKGLSKDGKNLLDLQSTFRDMVANAGPNDVEGGTAGFDALAQGRQAWAQAMKMGDLERIQQRAALTDNPATSIKSGVRVLLSNPTRVRGYSPDELTALKDAADRGVLGSIFHVFGGRLLPMGAALIGEHGAGPVGAVVAGGVTHGGTSLMRNLAEKLQGSRLQGAIDAIGNNAPPPPGWKPTPPAPPALGGSDMSGLVPWRPMLATPEQPQPSINPATGLPEFNLKANQEAVANGIPQQIAAKLVDGTLADHKALGDWINQNKRQLRSQFGGQGIQNIMQVGALVRRASAEPAPSTVFSALMKGAAPQIMESAGGGAAALIAKAIASPELAKALATKSKGSITKIGQNRLTALLSAPDGNGLPNSIGAGANERNAANVAGSNRIFAAPTDGANLEAGSGFPNVPGPAPQSPQQVPQNRIAARVGA